MSLEEDIPSKELESNLSLNVEEVENKSEP